MEASDCLRYRHGMERHHVGPSFSSRLQRGTADRAGAVDYLVEDRNGSVGAMGRTVMPRHPQVTETQAREDGAVAGVAAGAVRAAAPGASATRAASGATLKAMAAGTWAQSSSAGPIVLRQRHRAARGLHQIVQLGLLDLLAELARSESGCISG